MKVMVLVLFIDADITSDSDRLWLAEKGRKVGKGKLNGYGGEQIEGETREEAAIREVYEEGGVIVLPQDLKRVALLHIYRDGHGHEYECYVFTTRRWSGSFVETDEMALPQPYLFTKIPYQQMMPADQLWLPPVLFGLTIEAKFRYSEDRKEVLNFDCHTALFV